MIFEMLNTVDYISFNDICKRKILVYVENLSIFQNLGFKKRIIATRSNFLFKKFIN